MCVKSRVSRSSGAQCCTGSGRIYRKSGLKAVDLPEGQVVSSFPRAESMRFDEQKITEAATLLLELRGGCMHYIKLLKLLYIADRQALSEWGVPISNDNYVSMDNGPILSQTYNLIKDGGRFWSEYISAPFRDYEVELSKPIPKKKKLSPAEEEMLRNVFKEYGHKNRWKIVDFMHTLPEWKNPGGSSIPISIEDILQALNEPVENIRAILTEIEQERKIEEHIERADRLEAFH
jgi:uncharacterized phage-associated protein